MQKRRNRGRVVQFTSVELGGTRYAILTEAALAAICQESGIEAQRAPGSTEPDSPEGGFPESLDGQRLARRLAERRKRVGLTQSELARRAGVRVETVNRIERGRVTPDFGTIRKLVEAMSGAEQELAQH